MAVPEASESSSLDFFGTGPLFTGGLESFLKAGSPPRVLESQLQDESTLAQFSTRAADRPAGLGPSQVISSVFHSSSVSFLFLGRQDQSLWCQGLP